jgi:hypothetical protein
MSARRCAFFARLMLSSRLSFLQEFCRIQFALAPVIPASAFCCNRPQRDPLLDDLINAIAG